MEAKPKIALVGRPSEVAIDSGSAKNARYASEFPSIRNSSLGESPLLFAIAREHFMSPCGERLGARRATPSIGWKPAMADETSESDKPTPPDDVPLPAEAPAPGPPAGDPPPPADVAGAPGAAAAEPPVPAEAATVDAPPPVEEVEA